MLISSSIIIKHASASRAYIQLKKKLNKITIISASTDKDNPQPGSSKTDLVDANKEETQTNKDGCS